MLITLSVIALHRKPNTPRYRGNAIVKSFNRLSRAPNKYLDVSGVAPEKITFFWSCISTKSGLRAKLCTYVMRIDTYCTIHSLDMNEYQTGWYRFSINRSSLRVFIGVLSFVSFCFVVNEPIYLHARIGMHVKRKTLGRWNVLRRRDVRHNTVVSLE